MCNNLKQKCIENKQILTSTYTGVPLKQSSGNKAPFQQLLPVLTEYTPIKDIWMKNSTKLVTPINLYQVS